jgi:hypothetical protein
MKLDMESVVLAAASALFISAPVIVFFGIRAELAAEDRCHQKGGTPVATGEGFAGVTCFQKGAVLQ